MLSLSENDKPAAAVPAAGIAVIAVAAGGGLTEIFTSLGVSNVVRGGQTMNQAQKIFWRQLKKCRKRNYNSSQ